MEPELAQRIDRIVARRRQERSAAGPSGDEPDQDRRHAHDRVVAEMPRLATVVANALAELNDFIADADIRIKAETADHLPSAEAIYTFSVFDLGREDPVLNMSVDYTGVLRAILHDKNSRSVILSSTVFSINDAEILNILVTLLEAQYR